MDNVVANEHVQVLIPPDAGKRNTPRPGWDGGRYTSMRQDTSDRLRRRALPKTKGDGRAGVRTDQAQPAHQSVPATRQIRRTLGVAADHRHPQPTEAPQAPDSRCSGLKDRPAEPPTTPRSTDHHQDRSPHKTSKSRRPRIFARHPPSYGARRQVGDLRKADGLGAQARAEAGSQAPPPRSPAARCSLNASPAELPRAAPAGASSGPAGLPWPSS